MTCEVELPIEAPVEAVWKALTEAEDDAYLRFRLDPPGIGSERCDAKVHLSTYGIPEARVTELQTVFDRILEEALG